MDRKTFTEFAKRQPSLAKALRTVMAGEDLYLQVGIVETLLSNTEKQMQSALKSMKQFRTNPAKFKPQLKNVRQYASDMRAVSRRILNTLDAIEKSAGE